MRPSTKLRQLLRRKNKVLAVLGAPNAFHAKIMEASGVEACFVGTSITGGNYTRLPDLGILSMTECVGFAKWIAEREDASHSRRRHGTWRYHGGAPSRARVHRRRTGGL